MLIREAANQETIRKIVGTISSAGGRAYLVGGAVRDKHIAGQPASKDVDFLVTGLTREQIVAAISQIGKAKEVGEAFGVVTGRVDGEDFDFALPRSSETKTGEGHTDFAVETDPNASPETDLARRDFTFNAMLEDPVTGEMIDPFGGLEDLRAKVVRTVGDPRERFKEDPLRMLRAIQFASRFGFTIEQKTAQAIRELAQTLKSVSGERVLLELRKAWTKGVADMTVLVDLFKDLGLGDVFFGPEFDPIPISLSGSSQDKELGNFVAFFLNGGNYSTMKPSNDFVEHLKLTRAAIQNVGRDAWKWSGARTWEKSDPQRLARIAKILDALHAATGENNYGDAATNIEATLDLPLTPTSLAVSGADLQAIGLKGKDIGSAMTRAMDGVYFGAVANEKNALFDYLGRKNSTNEAVLRSYIRSVLLR